MIVKRVAQSGLTAEAIEAIKADEVRHIPLGRHAMGSVSNPGRCWRTFVFSLALTTFGGSPCRRGPVRSAE
jgi:hypothetical protein